MANKARKKPVEVEYVQWTGGNVEDMRTFILDTQRLISFSGFSILIHTLEGIMETRPGDYIIKGVEGEFYPCKPDIFHKTYEEVPQSELEAEIECYGAIREV